jgi:hypothetical protein
MSVPQQKHRSFQTIFPLQANAGVMPEIDHDRFFPHHLQLNIHYPNIWRNTVQATVIVDTNTKQTYMEINNTQFVQTSTV